MCVVTVLLQDELMWVAVWMYKATKDAAYLRYIVQKDAQYYWSSTSMPFTTWDNKIAPSQILLAQVNNTVQCFATFLFCEYLVHTS